MDVETKLIHALHALDACEGRVRRRAAANLYDLRTAYTALTRDAVAVALQRLECVIADLERQQQEP